MPACRLYMRWIALALLTLSAPFAVAQLNPPLGLTLRNRETLAWHERPVTTGLMLPQGQVSSTASLVLYDVAAGAAVPAQFLPTAVWPDTSLKWVLLDAQASLGAGEQRRYELRSGAPPTSPTTLSANESVTQIMVQDGARSLVLNKNELRILGREFLATLAGQAHHGVPFAALETDAFPSPMPPWQVEERGPLKLVVRSDGELRRSGDNAPAGPLIRYRMRLTMRAGQPACEVALTLQNNQSFDWAGESETAPLPDLDFTAISFGEVNLVPGSAHNRFGPGLECTWRLQVPLDGSAPQTVRVQVDPANSSNTFTAPPLFEQDRADIDRIGGWGQIVPPLHFGADPALQALSDRYEKTQRARVAPEDVETLLDFSAGNTVFDHMVPQLGSYKDYGDLSWEGNWSRNHYDWIYGMELHWLRTGEPRFHDAATIFARHQADLDVYHTWHDGVWFNFMNHWEGAGGGNDNTHDSPFNSFGGGRPTHTWNQGYMLHWLLTGDRRARDAAYEVLEGARQYLYLANGGHPMDREIRNEGWLAEVFLVGQLVDPFATQDSGETGLGPQTYAQSALRALDSILELEQSDGGHGYVTTDPGGNNISPVQMHYVLEPLIKAHERLLAGQQASRATAYLALLTRILIQLRTRYACGDTAAEGYRPLQMDAWQFTGPRPPDAEPPDYQFAWLLKAANAAAYLHTQTGDAAWRDFARQAFRDFVYYRECYAQVYVDPAFRTPTGYRSQVFVGTESKIQGWIGRYGQYYLRMERDLGATLLGVTTRNASRNWELYN